MTTYGEELLGERAKNRISQTELSNRTGIFVQTIVDIENNRIGIDKETYDRFVSAIQQKPDSAEQAA